MHAELAALAGAGRKRRRRSAIDDRTVADALVRLGDLGVVVASGLLAALVRFGGAGQPDVVTAALLLGTLLAANVFSLARIYDPDRLARLSHQLPRLLGGWAITVGAVLAIFYGMKSGDELSRLWVGYWLLAGCGGFGAWRVLVRHAIEAAQAGGRLRRKLVLVGDGALMADCVARLGSDRRGPRIAGALVLSEGDRHPLLPGDCRRIRNVAELETAVRELEIDQAILTTPLGRTDEIQALLRRLKHLPLEVSLYPDLVGNGLPVFGLTRLADMPLMQLMQRPLDGWPSVLKALEDRVLAVLLLVLAAPAMAAIAAAIRLTSPGPVFYRQLRHGFNREPIMVFKFRTMHADRCDPPGARSVSQATRGDPRVTPLGSILRRTSLDELPQLLNVVRGEMSLVGPRPHAVAHDDHYGELIDDYLGRHRVRPGITGWAQVNGCRGETRSLDEMRRRIELDLEYIENWSLWFDLKVLFRTAIAGFAHDRAY